jgi:hypothetical protein
MDWIRWAVLFAIAGGLLLLVEWFRRRILDPTLSSMGV